MISSHMVAVKVDHTFELPNNLLIKAIRDRIHMGEYSLINGKLHRYERSSWNDYEFIPVNDLNEETENKIKSVLMAVKTLEDFLMI